MHTYENKMRKVYYIKWKGKKKRKCLISIISYEHNISQNTMHDVVKMNI